MLDVYLYDRHRLGRGEDPKRSHTETSLPDQETFLSESQALHAGPPQLPAASRSLFLKSLHLKHAEKPICLLVCQPPDATLVGASREYFSKQWKRVGWEQVTAV